MNKTGSGSPAGAPWWAETHTVENMPPALQDYNLYASDAALHEAVLREGAAWAEQELTAFGQQVGQAEYIALGFQANENKPQFFSHSPQGERIDEVRYHPAYHRLMQTSIENGLHSSHWTDPGAGAQVARAAKFYLQSQIEAGHGCPITMTSAVIPALRHQPALLEQWGAKIMARNYDPGNRPYAEKAGVTIGMAMTEKQGGSDVRSNSTVAHPAGNDASGDAFELVGHKYFVSAPMSDAFLVLAQSPGGLSCFLMPRWRPDGSKNAMHIQRLKDKMGNVSNASSEVELRGALAWMVGEEGRGVRTIIDMVAMTRFDCMVGSAAGMRQAVAQVSHYCRRRAAFGSYLSDQPLMQNVLADLAIEQEAALALTMRIARALDQRDEQAENLLVRIGTSVGKYWICKRTPGHAYEAMECIGGSGVMEERIMPRLFRESPINAIWEGSGNVQCLDMLRAMNREAGSLDAFLAEVERGRGGDRRLDRFMDSLAGEFGDSDTIEYRARRVVQKMALALQGSLLVQYADNAVADGYCASRLTDGSGWLYGSLPAGVDCKAIIERALPAEPV
ncbi:MAG: acyl-CoA dehydrogenase family protein [Gammaproteobacteria bacterium]|nr:MAG: acyl-CoA dehydrogenase family protein [Gammaproteobacteria bacterium]